MQVLAPVNDANDISPRSRIDSKVTNGGGVATTMKMTRAAYDALGTKDANTMYVIVG